MGMVIVWRAEQSRKASFDIASREVGSTTLTRSKLPIIKQRDERKNRKHIQPTRTQQTVSAHTYITFCIYEVRVLTFERIRVDVSNGPEKKSEEEEKIRKRRRSHRIMGSGRQVLLEL